MAFKLSEAIVEIRSSGLARLNRDFDLANRSNLTFARGIDRSGRVLNETARRGSKGFGRLRDAIGNASSQIGVFGNVGGGAIQGLTTAMGGLTAGIAAVGVAAAVAGVAITAIVTVAAVKRAGELEQSLANVATISKQVEGNIKGVTREIVDLSIKANTDANLLSEGLYQAISAGITDAGEALEFLGVAAVAAKGGLTTVETAVDGLTSVINAYGLTSADAEQTSDKLFKTVQLGKTNFEQLSRSIGNVAPLAAQMNVSLDDVLGAITAITLTGKGTSEAVTGIRQALTQILRPSEGAKKVAKELGIEFNAQALAAKGLRKFLEDLGKATGGSSEKLSKLFGDIEGLQSVLVLTGNQAKTFADNTDAITRASGDASNAFEIQNATFQSQANLLKTQLNAQLLRMGEKILPSVTRGLEELNAILAETDFSDLGAGIGALISPIADVVKGIGAMMNAWRNLSSTVKNSPVLRALQLTLLSPLVSDDSLIELTDILSGKGTKAQREARIAVGQQALATSVSPSGFRLQPLEQSTVQSVLGGLNLPSTTQGDEIIEAVEQRLLSENRRRRPTLTQAALISTPPAGARAVRGIQPRRREGIFAPTLTGEDFFGGIEANFIERQNESVEEAIRLLDLWKLEFENVGATADQEMTKLLELLEAQSITVIDGIPKIRRYSDGWAQAQRRIGQITKKSTDEARDQVGDLVDFIKEAIPKADFEAGVKRGLIAPIQGFVAQAIAGYQRQANTFSRFQMQIEADALQAQVAMLEDQARIGDARLLEFDAEIEARKKAIDRDVENHKAAEKLKTALTKQAVETRLQLIDRLAAEGKFLTLGPTAEIPRPTPEQRRATEAALAQIPSGLEKAFFQTADQVKDFGVETAKSFRAINTAIQGAEAGGVVGAIVGFTLALLQETQGFNKIMEATDKALGELVVAIEPLVSVLAESLIPVFETLSNIVAIIAPLLELWAKAMDFLLKPATMFANVLSDLTSGIAGVVADIIPGGDGFLKDLPKEQQAIVRQELRDRGNEFRRLRNLNQLPEEIAKLPPALREAAFLRAQGPINVQPLVPGDNVQLGALGAIKDQAEEDAKTERRERATGGIQISNITGATRDILVAALSPLNQLDTTFPLMLDVLKDIRGLLGGQGRGDAIRQIIPALQRPDMVQQAIAGANIAAADFTLDPATNLVRNQNLIDNRQMIGRAVNPQIPNFNTPDFSGIIPMNGQIPLPGNPDLRSSVFTTPISREMGGETSAGDNITIQGGINISVEQITDLTPEEIDRQLKEQLDIERLKVGSHSRFITVS